ncbi:MAG: DUF1549 domain-containing protein [bacterium]|nr:DUF1549 domain-containing protein [bacterium]
MDAFILRRLAAAGPRPAATADRATLIRRLCFDLTGLPPSPAEWRRSLATRPPIPGTTWWKSCSIALDQDTLSYMRQGRRERLTKIQGELIQTIV